MFRHMIHLKLILLNARNDAVMPSEPLCASHRWGETRGEWRVHREKPAAGAVRGLGDQAPLPGVTPSRGVRRTGRMESPARRGAGRVGSSRTGSAPGKDALGVAVLPSLPSILLQDRFLSAPLFSRPRDVQLLFPIASIFTPPRHFKLRRLKMTALSHHDR